jgi:hypothetical protein
MRDAELEVIVTRFLRRERRLRGAFVLMLLALILGPPLGAWRGWWSWAVVPYAWLNLLGLPGGYLAAYASNFWNGLVHASARPWRLRVSDGDLQIVADGRRAFVRLDRIVGASWRFDDSFDTLRGVDGLLTLQLEDGARVPIHDGAEGFSALLAWLDARRLVTRVPVCGD